MCSGLGPVSWSLLWGQVKTTVRHDLGMASGRSAEPEMIDDGLLWVRDDAIGGYG